MKHKFSVGDFVMLTKLAAGGSEPQMQWVLKAYRNQIVFQITAYNIGKYGYYIAPLNKDPNFYNLNIDKLTFFVTELNYLGDKSSSIKALNIATV